VFEDAFFGSRGVTCWSADGIGAVVLKRIDVERLHVWIAADKSAN
jgi:hypothetical protein